MLHYNIYSNINDQEYLEIERRLIIVEKKITDKLFPLGWKLTSPVVKNDTLIIDFIIDEKLFMGNLGIEYIDNSDGQSFSFYITKSFDEQERRYFVKEILYEHKTLSFFEENLEITVNDALILYQSWDKQFIIKNSK